MPKSNKKKWLACLLTMLIPGLGHVYAGKIRTGILIFATYSTFVLASFTASILIATKYNDFELVILLLLYVIVTVDSIRISITHQIRIIDRWYTYLLIIFLTYISFLQFLGLRTVRVPSGAMSPTIKAGDRIITTSIPYAFSDPKRGDIVIFPFPVDPSKNFVERVIGLPSQKIEIKDKCVYIDGYKLDEPYVIHTDDRVLGADVSPRDNMNSLIIPDNNCFVMGDNRDESYDSRFWKFVELPSFERKALLIYWSWDSSAERVRWDRIGKIIR